MNDLFEYQSFDTDKVIGNRVGAAIVDYIIFASLCVFFIIAFGEKTAPQTYSVTGWKGWIPFIFWFIYFVIVEYLLNGSFGNFLAGVKVVSLQNSSLMITQVLIRRLGDIVDIWWCFGILRFLLVRKTRYNQRIGDLWAKTIVIDRKRRMKSYEELYNIVIVH